jgi:hypothetical protein
MPLPDAYQKHVETVHTRFKFCSPYRLGIAVGESEEDLPSPYSHESHADALYLSGKRCGEEKRGRNGPMFAAASGVPRDFIRHDETGEIRCGALTCPHPEDCRQRGCTMPAAGVNASHQGCAAHGLAHPCEVCAAELQLEQMRKDGNADDTQEATVHLAAVEHAHGVQPTRAPLTDQQVMDLVPNEQAGWSRGQYCQWMARAVERAHGIGTTGVLGTVEASDGSQPE